MSSGGWYCDRCGALRPENGTGNGRHEGCGGGLRSLPAPALLVFDADRHEYRHRGVLVPSVTQIIAATGLRDDRFDNPFTADLGTRVHRRIADQPHDPTPQHEDENGYLAGWRDFLKTTGFRPILSERVVFDAYYRFAGTIDVLGLFVAGAAARLALLDVKTGGIERWHELQTAAYGSCIAGPPVDRFCVYITEGGEFRLERHCDPEALPIFRAAACVWHARAKYNPSNMEVPTVWNP